VATEFIEAITPPSYAAPEPPQDLDPPMDYEKVPPPIPDVREPVEAPRPAVEIVSREPSSTTFSLVLVESADEDADQRRLAAVFRLLRAHPGNDNVRLTIRTRDGETIELALPSAGLDEDLRLELREVLGEQILVS
jgi:hypothetical protein